MTRSFVFQINWWQFLRDLGALPMATDDFFRARLDAAMIDLKHPLAVLATSALRPATWSLAAMTPSLTRHIRGLRVRSPLAGCTP